MTVAPLGHGDDAEATPPKVCTAGKAGLLSGSHRPARRRFLVAEYSVFAGLSRPRCAL